MSEQAKHDLSEMELAHLGEGVVAYLREMDSDELRGKFPGMPEIAAGTRLWAVFAADGRPILLTDERSTAIAGALQQDLTPVSIH
ncbi:MAG: BQ00720 family protein [Rhizobiaceae bacterium]